MYPGLQFLDQTLKGEKMSASKKEVNQEIAGTKLTRKKKEMKPLMIYRVLEPGHEDIGVELGNKVVELLPLTSAADLKDASGRIKNMEPGNFAIGRLTFLEWGEQITKKNVLVRK